VASTSNIGTFNFTGLATGIDTSTIISGLTKLNQQRIDTYKTQQQDIVQKQTTFAALQGKLFDLQSKAGILSRSAGGAFDRRAASTSDAATLTAAAGTAAVPGTYSVTVGSLAQANQVASQGFADPNAQIRQGTLTLQVGTGTATTVTVDSRNNTLQGLADSINAAGGDVKASIINDGSAAPCRLMLTSSKTGAANAINVTNNLTTGTGAAVDPAATTIQAAADAQVTLGSGPGAVTVSSATNQVSNLIPGVTLSLVKANPGNPVSLAVTNDTTAAASAVQDLVASYNAVVGFINDQTRFDTSTQTAGELLGNPDVAALRDALSSTLTSAIPGLSGASSRMSTVGLGFAADGTLQLDQGKLNQALSGQSGVSISDVKRMFGMTGASDNPGVAFVFGGSKTQPSGAAPYQVNVTAPATRAVVTAAGPPAPSVLITPANNSLILKLNGLTSSGITLDPGTYTPDQLVAMLQAKINANSALNGNLVSVGLDGSGKVQITSQAYGSTSQVSFAGGTALADLGFTGTESATGTNVAGSFTVGGITEAATGSGQTLTGSIGNKNTDGLQVRATGGTPTTANVTVTQGLAGRLGAVLNKYLDPATGRLKSVTDSLQQQYDDIGKTITKQNEILQQKTDQLTQQFAAMETAVNNLKGLQSQLASLVPVSYTGSK
jgi:flagellar hook-associated protein 2